jgi:hypothetical protein
VWLRISVCLIFVAFAIMLLGCSREHVKVVSIDPAFQGYVNDFVSDAATVGVHIVIDDLIVEFTNQLTSETLGECQFGNANQTPIIIIDAQDWPGESTTYQKVVLYHELGHCILNRQHVFTGTILQSYCSATSIMWPYIENETNMYTENWTWYIQEMFYYPTLDVVSQEPGNYCSFNNYWGGR